MLIYWEQRPIRVQVENCDTKEEDEHCENTKTTYTKYKR
jgi:hypothetical protein